MRSHRCIITLVAVWLLLAPLGARAQGTQDPADKTLSPYFFVEGGDPSIDRLPLKDTQVDVAIAGVIADVTVKQVYENHDLGRERGLGARRLPDIGRLPRGRGSVHASLA